MITATFANIAGGDNHICHGLASIARHAAPPPYGGWDIGSVSSGNDDWCDDDDIRYVILYTYVCANCHVPHGSGQWNDVAWAAIAEGRARAQEEYEEDEYRAGIETSIDIDKDIASRYDTAQALYSASDDGGVIDPDVMIRIAGAESPELHTTMTLAGAAEALGCLEATRDIVGDPEFGVDNDVWPQTVHL